MNGTQSEQADDSREKMAWRVENEVLITQDGIAFLAGGNQQPLKYATGELSPSDASLSAFTRNITTRQQHAQVRGIAYAHVVFPDKQSVLTDAFPLTPIVRLGEVYLNRAGPDVSTHVVYPTAALRAVEGACLPLDTHLSNTGSLVVLRHMLQTVGIDEPAALTRIEGRISRHRRWEGDLGVKLNPPRFQEALMLDPDWEFTHLSSEGGFNDGMIDILLSPKAPISKTVLLFGDSFFRLMLRHLTGVFTRVICLRTRFYHREMVDLIEPDIIFTGNAERYLSRVDSDDEASPFMLYRPLRGINDQFDPTFLRAWRSVTSPRSSQSRQFWDQFGLGPNYAS